MITSPKKINISLTLVFISVLLSIGCSREDSINCENNTSCEETIRVGDILLSDSTKSIFQFNIKDTLVFKNELGQELLFKVGYIDKGLFEDLLVTNCIHCENDLQFVRINYEHIYFSFYPINNQSFKSFRISSYIKVLEENIREERLFYEELYIGAFETDESDEGLLIIPKIHEVIGTFPKDFVEIQEQNIFHEEILLQNKLFRTVYSSKADVSSIFYFSFQTGLIGVKLLDEVWLYQGVK